MTVATKTKDKPAGLGARVPARELMQKLNTDAAKLNIWVRTEMNAPAQKAWFADTGGETGSGQLASGRIAANQLKTAAAALAVEGLSAVSRSHQRDREPRRRLADRVRRPPEHPADQSRPRRPPAGHQHDALRDLHL